MGVVLGRFVDRSHYECEHEFRIVKEPVHPSTIALLNHWRACQAHGGMRMGRDIPARAIATLMKDLTIAEPVDDWADARLRLVGSGMAAHFGRDVTGALMTDVFAGDLGDRDMLLMGAKNAIVRNRPGTVEQTIIDSKGRAFQRQEMTVMPLLSPDGDTHWALTGTFTF